jgi:hypothetical protein
MLSLPLGTGNRADLPHPVLVDGLGACRRTPHLPALGTLIRQIAKQMGVKDHLGHAEVGWRSGRGMELDFVAAEDATGVRGDRTPPGSAPVVDRLPGQSAQAALRGLPLRLELGVRLFPCGDGPPVVDRGTVRATGCGPGISQ